MYFKEPTHKGVLIKRYKRFLADVELEGSVVTAHCPNSGSMLGLKEPGSSVILSFDGRPGRTLFYTLQAVFSGDVWVGINTMLPNKIVAGAISKGEIPALKDYTSLREEVKYDENSRIDILLEKEGGPPCYVEVKNVTLKEGEYALFPDAVTARGLKHIHALMREKEKGARAVLFFLVQRSDCKGVKIAVEIDKAYGAAIKEALKEGLEVLSYACTVDEKGVTLQKQLPFIGP